MTIQSISVAVIVIAALAYVAYWLRKEWKHQNTACAKCAVTQFKPLS
jgi:hypothetical protein